MFDSNGMRKVTKLRVLQYRATYINGTAISNEINTSLSRTNLSLIDVAFVKEGSNESMKFVAGADKYSIWPGIFKLDHESLLMILSLFNSTKVTFHMMEHRLKKL